MEESEYMTLAESVPADWYTSEKAVEITKSIFYDIMMAYAMREGLVINDEQDLQKLMDTIAKDKNVPVDEVLLNVQNIATTVGAVKLFNESYPEIADQFPKDELGVPIYPPKFLAKILELTEEIAQELLDGVLKDYGEYLVPSR